MVLATVGRPDRLATVVDAVLADPGTRELVVVVDGDDPASVSVLRDLAATRPGLRHLAVPHRGQLGALDAGVRIAAGDVVVLLDDDVVPAPGTIARHVARHRQAGGLVVAGPMPVVAPAGRASTGTRLYAAEYDAHVAALVSGERRVLDALWTGNLSLRRTDCLRVGLASPAYRAHYHADRDLGYRLAAAGLVGLFDPALGAAHLHERSDAAFLRDARRQGAGRAALHRAHGSRLGPFHLELLVDDLPRPLGRAILRIGIGRHAEGAAAALMALGRRAGALGASSAERAAAKLARRVMQCQGAIAGEDGAPPPRRRRSWRGQRLAEAPDGG